MKTRTIKLTILFFLVGQFIYAQGWERTFDIYHESYHDTGKDILIASNGDYIISGHSERNGGDSLHIFVSRISPQGDEIWSQVYRNTDPNNLTLYGGRIVKASDDGYIVGGITNEQGILIVKIDENGDSLWTKSHTIAELGDHTFLRISNSPDGGYFLVSADQATYPQHSVLVKLDSVADLDWIDVITFPDSYEDRAQNIITSSDHLIIAGTGYTDSLGERTFIQKRDLDGNILWSQEFENPEYVTTVATGLKQLNDSSYVIVDGNTIFKTDSMGVLAWEKTYPSFDQLNSVDLTLDGGFILTGQDEYTTQGNLLLLKTDSIGDLLWNKSFAVTDRSRGTDVVQNVDSSIIVIGSYNLNGPNGQENSDLYVIKANSSGNIFDNLVKGRVFNDVDLNCEDDNGEPALRSTLVQVTGADTFYTYTDADGYYEIELDTGSYFIRSILPNPYWETCIDDPFAFEIVNEPDTVIVDLPAQYLIQCPYLSVDISTPRLRRCFDNILYARYCNYGTAEVQDAIVRVVLDPFLEYQSSSINLTSQNGDTLIFEVGDIDIGDCGVFNITTYLDCDSTVLGQAHCLKAFISPDSICLPVDPLWTGASLKVDAECIGDSLFFNIENIGDENMSSPQNFIITEDVIMYDEGEVELLSGQSMQVYAEATNGATWRLEVDQVVGHPGNSNPSVVVEGCVPFGTPFTQYFTNVFPQDDGDPFVSIDCQENIGSFDPNDKRGFPYGWDNEHFIERNEDLEYMIRFQNTGTDTAFTVKIKDQISPHLDITTLRPGASSHPYQLGFEGSDILTFTFDNIMLPDSNVNEAASHGFVKFKISQKEDLPLGTVIYNQAAIYFDFNEPIITNETFHTVAEPLITFTFEPRFFENVTIDAYPNPFRESTTIEVKGADFKNLKLHLYDIHGRIITSYKAENEHFTLQRKGLTTGIYLYRIESDGQLIGVGKLIIQ